MMLPYTRLVSVSCLPCLPDATTTLSSPIPQAQAAARAKSGPRDQSLTVLHASPPCVCCCPALATASSHMMTYKPNSVKDNKDRCCRPGLEVRALSVLTRGERNFIDRQHRKGKTFVAVVRAAGIWPMTARYVIT